MKKLKNTGSAQLCMIFSLGSRRSRGPGEALQAQEETKRREGKVSEGMARRAEADRGYKGIASGVKAPA